MSEPRERTRDTNVPSTLVTAVDRTPAPVARAVDVRVTEPSSPPVVAPSPVAQVAQVAPAPGARGYAFAATMPASEAMAAAAVQAVELTARTLPSLFDDAQAALAQAMQASVVAEIAAAAAAPVAIDFTSERPLAFLDDAPPPPPDAGLTALGFDAFGPARDDEPLPAFEMDMTEEPAPAFVLTGAAAAHDAQVLGAASTMLQGSALEPTLGFGPDDDVTALQPAAPMAMPSPFATAATMAFPAPLGLALPEVAPLPDLPFDAPTPVAIAAPSASPPAWPSSPPGGALPVATSTAPAARASAAGRGVAIAIIVVACVAIVTALAALWFMRTPVSAATEQAAPPAPRAEPGVGRRPAGIPVLPPASTP